MWRAGVIAACAALLGGYMFVRHAGPVVPVVHAEHGPIMQTVVATGRVITPARLDVGAALTGTVIHVAVRDGERVRAGQVLFTLDDAEAKASLAQSIAGIEQARARLDQVSAVASPVSEQNARQARATLTMAERDMKRAAELFDKGFVSQARIDEAARALELARAQERSAATQVSAAQPRGADYRLAQTGVTLAEAQRQLAAARLALTVIRAPADGIIVRRSVEPGSVVTAGKAVLEIASSGETQIVAQIDEKNLALLALDQTALAIADAYPGERFAARTFYINPGIDAQRGTVEVKLRVMKPPPFLLPDMTVSIEIRVAEKPAALTLATEHVRDLATEPWVLKIADGKAVRQPVTIGIRGTKRIEIVNGLAAADPVVPAASNVSSGAPVRVRDTTKP